MVKTLSRTGAVLAIAALTATAAAAQTLAPEQRLCDPEYQDCRADILTYIAQEKVEIDMGFWLMDDARYADALVAAWQRGVKVRVLMDPRCTSEHAACSGINDELSKAGLPMRNRITSGILHWKMALFAGQGQVEFSGANYSPFEMVAATPYQNYTDEMVMFTNEAAIVQSFMTKFDDLWTSTTEFANYANVTGALTRSYATYSEDPQLNFPPDQSYRTRAIDAYNAETVGIDVAMFRITDNQESTAIIAAVNRGIPVRLYTDSTEYRNPDRVWDAYNVDMLYHAGVTVRVDDHLGINHEKLVLLYGTGMTIFGSSNWTSPSSDTQREHNMFTTQPWIFAWAEDQFNRKWTNGSGFSESQPFTPLPPDVPVYNLPATAARTVLPTSAVLSWDAGYWGQLYDIYFGTTPNPPLFARDQPLGPSQDLTDYRTYPLPPLRAGTTYYWRIVSKTMAYLTAEGPIWSFTTSGAAPTASPMITSPANGATLTAPATIPIDATASGSSGPVTKVDFYAGNALIGTVTTSPYTFTWKNVPAGTYTLTAVATDKTGPTASAVVSISVVAPGSVTTSSGPGTSATTGASSGSSSAGSATTASSGGCTIPDPFVSIGGGHCVNGGWIPGPAPSTSTTPTTTDPPAASTGTCTIPDPFVSIGGGHCVDGGWIPGPAPSTSTTTATTTVVPPPTVASASSAATCTIPDPFVSIGGGHCVNGGWIPGPAPSTSTGTTTSGGATATSSGTSTTQPGGCTIPDPFTSIGGGICINGGWVPKGY